MSIVFKSISNKISTKSQSWVNIPDLAISVTDLAYKGSKEALVTLTIPSPYAAGNNYPGINFAITMNGEVLSSGSVTSSIEKPTSFGRTPFSLQVLVDLSNHSRLGLIQAQWCGIRGSEANIDSPCSISAVVN
ncbi:hypothetical protein [Pectobacterium polaris]|uniref:Bc2l-C N-terminal domain-containing protein n=1 Tax=Pectobacterium polaris TaxID=2042057 RepID=A0AAW5GBB1_9GAMM|nr:hypothetical protein [Pectobacterium polaris]MCL6350604.1 hypothetical protein [Pectobacterium polaris]MCL6368002.1 hypothetical protein [Pectobacterium polaris]MDG0802940.1 hypothetical protein [Pectobacterium polaris]